MADKKGLIPLLSLVYIADGFQEDCNDLVERFLQTDSLRYETFANIFKDMNFSYVFFDRQFAEVLEFSEEVLYITKKIMVEEPDNYPKSVAGLYLSYAMVKLQPYDGFAHIRLTPKDIPAIKALEQNARTKQDYDVLYILSIILFDGSVQYHFKDRDYGMEKPCRRYFEEQISVSTMGRRQGVLSQTKEELETLRQLSSLSRKYFNAKALVSGKDKPEKSLSYANENLASELATSLKKLIQEGTWSPDEEEDDRPQRVTNIKRKAMTIAVGQSKHRISKKSRKKTNIKPTTSTGDSTPSISESDDPSSTNSSPVKQSRKTTKQTKKGLDTDQPNTSKNVLKEPKSAFTNKLMATKKQILQSRKKGKGKGKKTLTLEEVPIEFEPPSTETTETLKKLPKSRTTRISAKLSDIADFSESSQNAVNFNLNKNETTAALQTDEESGENDIVNNTKTRSKKSNTTDISSLPVLECEDLENDNRNDNMDTIVDRDIIDHTNVKNDNTDVEGDNKDGKADNKDVKVDTKDAKKVVKNVKSPVKKGVSPKKKRKRC